MNVIRDELACRVFNLSLFTLKLSEIIMVLLVSSFNGLLFYTNVISLTPTLLNSVARSERFISAFYRKLGHWSTVNTTGYGS